MQVWPQIANDNKGDKHVDFESFKAQVKQRQVDFHESKKKQYLFVKKKGL